ncbi:WRKY transcription factor 1 [Glycine soja]|uniref:WRKY transcription factor 1 n=1 Tax=Glycine soja TaxID=3848 RepID=A0A445INN3_GLYSO|nr:WRKY transcription factor 1 [Glycine soja]
MEGCQPLAEQMQSSNDVAKTVKLPLPFDLNTIPNEDEEARPATSDETWLPDSESDDNFRPLQQPSSTPDAPVDIDDVEDRASIVEGGSDSGNRKRKRSLEESDKGTAGRSFHGETELTVRIGSKKEIDDDGYRWRKYGQKIMKGCLYPRAYYKCASAGCFVRKHVERDSRNNKNVIITYDGRHNHEQPPSWITNKNKLVLDDEGDEEDEDDGGEELAPTNNALITRNFLMNTPNPAEPQVHTLQLRNDMNPEFANRFMRPNHFGSLNNNMNIGSSSNNPHMHYSFLNNTNSMPHRSYGFNLDNPYATPQPRGKQVQGTSTRFLKHKQEQDDNKMFGEQANAFYTFSVIVILLSTSFVKVTIVDSYLVFEC